MASYEQVTSILAEHLDIEQDKITTESTFESLGIDSLDTVEIIMELEDALGISIETDAAVKTVGDLVQLIDGGKN
jgi:acyl carrier protein